MRTFTFTLDNCTKVHAEEIEPCKFSVKLRALNGYETGFTWVEEPVDDNSGMSEDEKAAVKELVKRIEECI